MTTMKKTNINKEWWQIGNNQQQQQQQFIFKGLKEEVDHVLWCKKIVAHE
jgi:hypothetical protein